MIIRMVGDAKIVVRESGAIEHHSKGRTLRVKFPNFSAAVEHIRKSAWGTELRFTQTF